MKIETNSKIVRNRSLDNTYDNCERFYCSESDKRGIRSGFIDVMVAVSYTILAITENPLPLSPYQVRYSATYARLIAQCVSLITVTCSELAGAIDLGFKIFEQVNQTRYRVSGYQLVGLRVGG